MKILVIQNEFGKFSYSMPMAFHGSAGLAHALQEVGHEVDFVLSADTEQMNSRASQNDYDFALIIDIVHGVCSVDPCAYRVPILPLLTLKRRGIPIAGMLMETLFHERVDSDAMLSMPDHRLAAISQTLMWLDCFITFDRTDAEKLREIGARVLWAPFSSSDPFPEAEVNFSSELVFVGNMYGKRQKFLSDAGMAQQIKAGYVNYPDEFAQVHKELIELAVSRESADKSDLFNQYRQFKHACFAQYTHFLKHLPVIINLPSIFQGIACRTVESLWLNRMVVSPRPRHPVERHLQDTVPHMLFQYEEDEPASFATALQSALASEITIEKLQANYLFLQASPFNPKVQAVNIADFVARKRTSQEIEHAYFENALFGGA